MTKKTSKTPSWVWRFLPLVSLGIGIIGIAWIMTQVFYYQPKLNRLEDIYYNFAVVEDYYEVVEIAQSIPLPSPLGPITHLDYSPITVYKGTPNAIVDFRGSSYGYVLKLSTGLNTYLATSDSEGSPKLHVLYTIGELRDNRLRLHWFLYNGPLPPEEWIQNSK